MTEKTKSGKKPEEISEPSVLIDNRSEKMADYLREHLRDASELRLVSAYFSIYGYKALAKELQANPTLLNNTRFLLGEPESADSVTGDKKPSESFTLTESGLALAEEPAQQSELARQCAEWVEKIKVRSVSKSNFLHGKMYHMETPTGGAATIGSSNFTRNGLGEGKSSNMEINIALSEPKELKAIVKWFDELWEETEDVQKRVLKALERLYEDRSPRFVYYKTLYELLRPRIENRVTENLEEQHGKNEEWSFLWGKLYKFQQDAAATIIQRLSLHGGCILADSVGLGKTFTALAVIKYYLLRNKSVVVLAPKKLEQNWRLYQSASNDKHNPLSEARLNYHLLAHTDLTLERGIRGPIDLATFNWDYVDLLVIDESHNFRNKPKDKKNEEGHKISSSRQSRLMEIIQKGKRKHVLMLSATPVNTSLMDLRNQINFATAGDETAFQETLELPNIGKLLSEAQKEFQKWEKTEEQNKDELLTALGGDFMNLLSNLTVARSRRQIQIFYKEYIKEKGNFPKTKLKNKYPHTDTKEELSYDVLNEELKKLEFNIYRPSAYVREGSDAAKDLEKEKERLNLNQKAREKLLVAMMRVNFLKRLESSAHSLQLTLKRTIEKIEAQLTQLEEYIEKHPKGKQADSLPDDDERTDSLPEDDDNGEDEEFVVNRNAIKPLYLRDLKVEEWHEAVQRDLTALQEIKKRVKVIKPERDNKLHELKKYLTSKAAKENRKILLFTTFKDTARYLYDHLKEHAQGLNLNMALVAGDLTLPPRAGNFNDILTRFSPVARTGDGLPDDEAKVDLLIATDCISEGQNLQDCDMVLNYDIHWNPVRLIQRFGRINRIGSKNKIVRMLNYWPTENMEIYLNLKSRVHARMALADATATGDDNFLENEKALESAVQGSLNFRDRDLEAMRQDGEVPDWEGQTITFSDLTLDYFLMQVLRYIEKNKVALDDAPNGIYAVVKNAPPGVIFFFQHKESKDNVTNSLTHPFYLVHVGEKTGIIHKYTEQRTILKLFENLTDGKEKALTSLCDLFREDQKTPKGRDRYNDMAKEALAHIQSTYKGTTTGKLGVSSGGNRAFTHPMPLDAPAPHNLELITWLVIKND